MKLQLLIVTAIFIAQAATTAAEGGADLCASTKTDDLVECVADRLRVAERKLDEAITKLRRCYEEDDVEMRRFGSPDGTDHAGALDREHAAWHSYRDALCERREYRGITGREYEIYLLGCKAEVTAARAGAILEAFAADCSHAVPSGSLRN
jgi:uncharacterized protein YecT (DUF1311 family)